MNLHNSTADIFIPDGLAAPEAFSRISHLGIGAHQDDLEFMAFHGILACFQNSDQWFGGVTCTNGAGSARTGAYAQFGDEEMQAIRRKEQNLAAQIGQYGAMIQLDFPSSAVKGPEGSALREDLVEILLATRPRVIYTHNLADKHDTHIGVAVAAIHAVRSLPMEQRPNTAFGCEVWRNLDWMPDSQKVIQDLSFHENLAAALNGVFDSQIAGGKRYDLGVIGRRRSNATFFESHSVDRSDSIAFAMDLSPLVRDDSLDIADYIDELIGSFRAEVIGKLRAQVGHKGVK